MSKSQIPEDLRRSFNHENKNKPSGEPPLKLKTSETPPCANAWEVSKLIASLEARLEALEARWRALAAPSNRSSLGLRKPLVPFPKDKP